MQPKPIRDELAFTIRMALLRIPKAHFRELLKSHGSELDQQIIAEAIADHILLSNFEVKQKPPASLHSTPGPR